jgi:hypothetical protein
MLMRKAMVEARSGRKFHEEHDQNNRRCQHTKYQLEVTVHYIDRIFYLWVARAW